MIITILGIILSTVIGTTILFCLLPDSKKEWSILLPLFVLALVYFAGTIGSFLMAWVVISAFSGNPVATGVVLGTIWVLITIGVGRAWLNG